MTNEKSKVSIFVGIIASVAMFGCERSPEVKFHFNQVEWVRQERINLDEEEFFQDSYKKEIGTILTALFGKPDHPDFQFLYEEDDPAKEVVDLENLKLAAGSVRQGAGLYRRHCVQCHGISGDGKGPTARFLNPYPRDFRLGKFKFKSTPLKKPPTNQDLVEVIRSGINGTSMPAFTSLSPKEVSALIDYVKYLTIRGQLERRLLGEVYAMDGDPLLDLRLVSELEQESDRREEFEDQLATIVEEFLIEDIVERWAVAEDAISDVPPPPESYHREHPDHELLVKSGRQLFRGKANCVQCHGPTGLGDGQNENYDDWTSDWLNTAGVNPKDPSTYRHFLNAGAYEPRNISPRNLQLGIFRGGNRPEDIYRRISNGIEGTPMPSAPTLSSDEVWALVAFVRELKFNSVSGAGTDSHLITALND